MTLTVCSVGPEIYEQWLLRRHYAARIPGAVSAAYGLWLDGECLGVVTFGPPPSPQVARSIVGEESPETVLELNRLVVCAPGVHCAASRLVSAALNQIGRHQPRIIVSYADANAGHVGYIYQATGFTYYGRGPLRTAEVFTTPDGKTVHRRSLTAYTRDAKTYAQAAGWGVADQEPKHRYARVVGSKYGRRRLSQMILWTPEPYPKGDTRRHDCGDAAIGSQIELAI